MFYSFYILCYVVLKGVFWLINIQLLRLKNRISVVGACDKQDAALTLKLGGKEKVDLGTSAVREE